MKKIMLFAGLALTLSGCATAITHEAAHIVQVNENEKNQVKDCKTLGQVTGTSSYGGLFMQEAGKSYAKNQAINDAANMGATHVMWTLAEGGFFGGHAAGVAYKCPKVAAN
ncbi:hypothetical protein CIK05_05040 [Bdellovibrio sp. qaytius]|nr:hypothetical protein CIK05_05040 [Bdellovibrio sp. qaytius]